jgi:hypothetical protein
MSLNFTVTIRCTKCGHEKNEYFDDYYVASRHVEQLLYLLKKASGYCTGCHSDSMPEVFCSAESKKISEPMDLTQIPTAPKEIKDCCFCRGQGQILVAKDMHRHNRYTSAVFNGECAICKGKGYIRK